jgi:hypothetical protein
LRGGPPQVWRRRSRGGGNCLGERATRTLTSPASRARIPDR